MHVKQRGTTHLQPGFIIQKESSCFVALFFRWFSTLLVSWRSLGECASFANQGQANSSQKQIPALPGRVYRLHQLSFPSGPYSFSLTSALPPPTRSSACTMTLTEAAGDKDSHVGVCPEECLQHM